jgi:hypothetical protein
MHLHHETQPVNAVEGMVPLVSEKHLFLSELQEFSRHSDVLLLYDIF